MKNHFYVTNKQMIGSEIFLIDKRNQFIFFDSCQNRPNLGKLGQISPTFIGYEVLQRISDRRANQTVNCPYLRCFLIDFIELASFYIKFTIRNLQS